MELKLCIKRSGTTGALHQVALPGLGCQNSQICSHVPNSNKPTLTPTPSQTHPHTYPLTLLVKGHILWVGTSLTCPDDIGVLCVYIRSRPKLACLVRIMNGSLIEVYVILIFHLKGGGGVIWVWAFIRFIFIHNTLFNFQGLKPLSRQLVISITIGKS